MNAVAGAGRKPKVKVTGDTDFEKVYDIDVPTYMEEMSYAPSMWRTIVKELLSRKNLKIRQKALGSSFWSILYVTLICISCSTIFFSKDLLAVFYINLFRLRK